YPVFRDLRVNGGAEGIDVIDALACKNPLPEQVLVDIGHCMRVQVERHVSGVNPGESAVGTRSGVSLDARLDNAVTGIDSAGAPVEHSTVQRVRHRADQLFRGTTWQQRIRIECDDVANVADVSDSAALYFEIIFPRISKVVVELHELSALALPSHPAGCNLIPPATPVKQYERGDRPAAVSPVQLVHRFHDIIKKCLVAGHTFGRCVEIIRQKYELHRRIAVAKPVQLEHMDIFVDRLAAREHCGYHDSSTVFGWDAVGEIELWQPVRPPRAEDEGIDEV